ncbi:MAG: cytochrome c oxidase accessory protein CcoG [Gammaproteobacteria bacterium]|nr:cytochrome c oxidase accessory protein CcoG [Gammaproteobacteria bacterium]
MNGSPTEDPIRLEGFGPRDLYQRREKIFTRYIGGIFQKLRFFTGWPLLTGYFLLPWLNWGERQAVLFDLPAREFHILGLTFWPQDLWLLGWLLIIAAFGLFTVTTLVGRLWCGYTCPQTVWTAIFMWVEQVTEGPRHQRVRLEQSPWTIEKLRKRTFKHAMWLGWAFLTGFTFVGYFTPVRELAVDFFTLDIAGWAGLWTLFFTLATYINAGWLREQVCIYMCPYARFQSAMFDKDTLIVSYDAIRGEPRGSRKRTAAAHELGDCVDCQLCVQVCPTGIDIRNGLQYECIGCAHCIDACAQVMDKMDYAPGLIRYTTEHELSGGQTRWFRLRSMGYGAAVVLMTCLFTAAVFLRIPFEVDVLRERGELYQHVAGNQIANQYRLRVLNKSQHAARLSLSLDSSLPLQALGVTHIDAAAGELLDIPLELTAPVDSIRVPNTEVRIQICEVDSDLCVSEVTRFLGPIE